MKKSTIAMFVITIILFVLGMGASYTALYLTYSSNFINDVFELIKVTPIVTYTNIGLAGFTTLLFLIHFIASLVKKMKSNLAISFVSLILGLCASTSTAIGVYRAFNIVTKAESLSGGYVIYMLLGGTIACILAYLFMLITICISFKHKEEKKEEEVVIVAANGTEENKENEVKEEAKEEVILESIEPVKVEKEEEKPTENTLTDEEVKKEEEKPIEEIKVEDTSYVETKPVEEENDEEANKVDTKKDENDVKLENKENKTELKPVKKTNNTKGAKKTMTTEKKETKKAEKPTEKKAGTKKATTTKAAEKPAAKKETSDKKATGKAYHLSKREEDGKWAIKLAKGEKVIKLFNTKAEALEYANKLSDNQDATLRVHASKGKSKGKIQKQ